MCTWESLIVNASAGRKKCRYQLFQEDDNISRSLALLMSFIFIEKWKPELGLKPSCCCFELFIECNANSQSITLPLREHVVKFLKEPKDHGVLSHLEEGLCTQKDISALSLQAPHSSIYLEKMYPQITVATERKHLKHSPFHHINQNDL